VEQKTPHLLREAGQHLRAQVIDVAVVARKGFDELVRARPATDCERREVEPCRPSLREFTLVARFFGLALAMGWVMAPATEAVVGAVPAAKSGVASATNTVARMVSGALGVAVIGSLVSSLYANEIEGSLAGLTRRGASASRGVGWCRKRDRGPAPTRRCHRASRHDRQRIHPSDGHRPHRRGRARRGHSRRRRPLPTGARAGRRGRFMPLGPARSRSPTPTKRPRRGGEPGAAAERR
jgi:hypothetical protein